LNNAKKTVIGRLESGTTNPSPSIECWLPSGDPSGAAVVIFPGGGYGGLAPHEGEGYAKFFCSAGVAGFVVKYRLATNGYRHPAMLEDALAAISTVRSHASEFGVDPSKVGVMGSSAGGHLAAHSLIASQKYRSSIPLRPDFGILCYPVITSQGPFAHRGSMANLAGADASTGLLEELSCEKHVSAQTPPCFLWHTGEDTGVPLENSIMFANALRKNGIPFELHLYPKGAHGLGLGAPFDWGGACLRWLAETTKSNILRKHNA